MILSTHGILASSGGVSIDADAQAFFDRVTTAGGSLTNTEKTAVNTLVLALKANSLWSGMKAIYPMVGASAAACAQNLKSSSFTGTFTSGWTFASTGATPNGTSAYMNTGFVPSSNISLNNAHLSYYSRTNVVGVQVDIGSIGDSTNAFYLIMNLNNIAPSGINAPETLRTSAMSPTLGMLIGSRIVSTEEKYYTNNVSQTLTKNSNSMNSFNVYLGCFNQTGTANLFSTKETAFASLGDGLTDTQASNFYTAVQAFQTTLSRNV